MKNKIKPSTFKIRHLHQNEFDSALLLLENVFYKEQNIPKKLIPLQANIQKWWCVRQHDEIVGLVAAWKIKYEWHWGRLAIHKKLRGVGLGKELVTKSFDALFQMGIEKVSIDARDITVEIVLKLGGKITGKTSKFYGYAITPMKIHSKDFICKIPE